MENRKAGKSRVFVKTSPAFGPRLLHTDTDFIVCVRRAGWFVSLRGGRGARRPPHAHALCTGEAPDPCPDTGKVEKVMAFLDDIYIATPEPDRVMEAHAVVTEELWSNARIFLQDMNVQVAADDQKRVEVLAQDLPCFGGAQLAVGVTLRGVLSSEGEAHPLIRTESCYTKLGRDKEATHPELMASRRCKLVVLAIETGGRWCEEAVQMVSQLSHAKAREVLSFMRFSVSLMLERMWSRMLAFTCATFAASLVEPASHVTWCHTGGQAPVFADLFEGDPR